MSKYEEALKNLSCDVSKLCKEMGWEMDNKDIEVMKELIQVKSDLEAKLAEKEHTINTLIEDHKASQEWYKKQLAEKEDRINWLVEAEFNREWAKKYVEMRRKEEPMLCLPDSDEVYQRYFEYKDKIAKLETQHDIDNQVIQLMEDNREKDKISFAVEQLRQVQKYIITDEKDMFGMPYLMKPSYIYDYIENQIKQLKEMK